MKDKIRLLQIEPLVRSIFQNVPFVQIKSVDESAAIDLFYKPDFMVELAINDKEYRLVLEAKESMQPRQLHGVAMQLREYCTVFDSIPCVIAPYISDKTAELCHHYKLNYLDLSGNCFVSFANVHIEKTGKGKEQTEKRELRSLFGEKASRILFVMLNEQLKSWQVKELAEMAQVSLGQVSNVRRRLLELEYAAEKAEGVRLERPEGLLQDWQKAYKKKTLASQGYFSLLNAQEKDWAVRKAFREAEDAGGKIALSGFSAARWIAPFAKSTTDSFYADEKGQSILIQCLELKPVEKGANVIIEQPKDTFLFTQMRKATEEMQTTSLIQTYLDISIAGERGQEAAEHLESFKLHEIWGRGNAGTNERY